MVTRLNIEDIQKVLNVMVQSLYEEFKEELITMESMGFRTEYPLFRRRDLPI